MKSLLAIRSNSSSSLLAIGGRVRVYFLELAASMSKSSRAQCETIVECETTCLFRWGSNRLFDALSYRSIPCQRCEIDDSNCKKFDMLRLQAL
jgi:hypothetical protein